MAEIDRTAALIGAIRVILVAPIDWSRGSQFSSEIQATQIIKACQKAGLKFVVEDAELPEVPRSEDMIAIDYTPQSWYEQAQRDMREWQKTEAIIIKEGLLQDDHRLHPNV